jgi:hypothetical protein
MTPRFNRRTLFGIAAGTAAAAAGASLREMRACRTKRVAAAADLTTADYVDRNGWILTPADEKSLDSPQQPTRP